MSLVKTNAILDASGGTTATINGYTPTVSNMAGRNRIINGAMVIDQRNNGASVTPSSGQFLVDRWRAIITQAAKFSARQNAGAVTPPTGFTNYLGITSLSAYAVTGNDSFSVEQIIEGFNVSDLNWGTASAVPATLSFWVRSSLTGTFGGSVATTRTAIWVMPFTFTISSANTWTYVTVAVTAPTATGGANTTNDAGVYVRFGLGSTGTSAGGTAGVWTSAGNYIQPSGTVSVVGTSGATFYITGVQLEEGSVATPFDFRQYGQELALCQRYFQLLQHSYGTSLGTTMIARCTWPLKVTMRANMTITAVGTPDWFYGGGTAFYSSIGTNYSIPEMAQVDMNVTSGPITSGTMCSSASGGTAYFTASAEL